MTNQSKFNKDQKSERKINPRMMILNESRSPMSKIKDEPPTLAYENQENDEIKFFEGNQQRETPNFSDIRSYLKLSKGTSHFLSLRGSQEKYDHFS